MATDVRQDIVDGTMDFARAAALYSDDPGSKDKGGDLGTFDRKRMVPAFTEAAFSQKVGEVGPPVKTEFGYHLIEVLDRVEEKGEVVKVHARHILFKLTPGADTIAAIDEKASNFRQEALDQGFAEAAQTLQLEVESPRPVREGRDIPGYPNTLAGAQFAFETKAGDISQVLKNDDIYYVLKNVETLPAGPPPLEDIKSQVVAKVVHDMKLAQAEAKLKLPPSPRSAAARRSPRPRPSSASRTRRRTRSPRPATSRAWASTRSSTRRRSPRRWTSWCPGSRPPGACSPCGSCGAISSTTRISPRSTTPSSSPCSCRSARRSSRTGTRSRSLRRRSRTTAPSCSATERRAAPATRHERSGPPDREALSLPAALPPGVSRRRTDCAASRART